MYPHRTQEFAQPEEGLVALFCMVDDTCVWLNQKGERCEPLKRLSDSEVLTLALFQQLRETRANALSCVTPKGSYLSRFPEWSVFLLPHSFVAYASVNPHLLYATNRVPLSYEPTPANAVEISLITKYWTIGRSSHILGNKRVQGLGRPRLPKRAVEGLFIKLGVLLVTDRAQRPYGTRQQVQTAFASSKVFRLGETLAATLAGPATRIAGKITAYTYAFVVNRRLEGLQGRIKELWA